MWAMAAWGAWILAFGDAWGASTPLLYQGDIDDAVRRVSADADLKPWELEPVLLPERLNEAGLRSFGLDQPPRTCTKGIGNDALRALVEKIEGHVSYEQWTETSEASAAAIGALPCLTESIDAKVAARLFFLNGISATARSDFRAARDAYLRALAFAPDLPWDETFTPDWQPTFDAARADHGALKSTAVVLGPGVDPSAELWVDGRSVVASAGRIELTEGLHLVQTIQPRVLTTEVRARLDRKAAVLVPSAVEPGVVEDASDPAVQAYLDPIVDSLFGEAGCYVWTGSRTVRGGADWRTLPSASLAVVAATVPGRASPATLLRVGGGTSAAIGAVATAAGLGMYLPNRAPVPGEVGEAYAARVDRAARGAGIATVGIGALGLGLVAIGASIPLDIAGSDVALVATPGGVSLVLGGAR